MCQVVIQFNKEYAIIAIYKADLFFILICPEAGLVRPVTCPFAGAPRIAQLE